MQFQENPKIQALINFGSEINIIMLTYIASLSLSIRETNLEAQKIDGLAFVIYEMVIVWFSIQDKLKRV